MYTKIRSGCIDELLDADDLALVSESLGGLKDRTEAWKRALESIGLNINYKKTKMITSGENARKVT